jgi:predicted RNA-binding Zn-ribbon protein involved in translation (DUF1610 family)
MLKDKKTYENGEAKVECIACLTRFRPMRKNGRVKCPGCGMVCRVSLSYYRRAGSRGTDRETNPTGDKL